MNTNSTDERGEDAKAEAFFEALAGRGKAHGGAASMRAAILAESQSLQAAHAAAAPDAASRDAQTFAMLVTEGVFVEARPALSAQAQVRQSFLASWQKRLEHLLALRWFNPALATCAAIACLLVIIPGREPGPDDSHEVLRGTAPHTVLVADPEAYAQAVVGELREAGATSQSVQINDRTWVISVTVPPGQSDAVKAALQRKGWRDIGRFPVDLMVGKR